VKNLFIILLLVSISSCSFFKKKNVADKDVVARVGDDYLYVSDVQPLTKGLKGNDSINAIKGYAESWVRKKLLLQKAKENIAEDDPEITKKVDDYRESLLLYEYEKALINKRLDTVITGQDMSDCYAKMKNDLPLEKDVYLVYFIKLKKDPPDIVNMRKWVTKPKDEEHTRKMEGYCREYATSYVIDDGMWYDKENVLKNFPLTESDVLSLNSLKSYKEFKNDDGILFRKIDDVVKAGEPAPMEFVRAQLVRAIIEKRRVQLIEKIYDKIYQDGIKSKLFEIFVK
jgi:hypothetical protein